MIRQTQLHWMQTRIRRAIRDFNLIEPGGPDRGGYFGRERQYSAAVPAVQHP